MNKAHRDRIAFMRICSGKFEAGMEVNPCAGWQEDASFPATADDGAVSVHMVDEAYARRYYRCL